MKRLIMALCALMISGLSCAATDVLLLKVTPNAPVYVENEQIYVTANSSRAGDDYRFVLEKYEAGQYVVLQETDWGALRDYPVYPSTSRGMGAGKYRLKAYVSESAGLPALMASKKFRVVANSDPDSTRIHHMNQALRSFEKAAFAVRNEMTRIKKKLATYGDTTPEFNHFAESENLARELLKSWGNHNLVGWETAPGGGPEFIAGVPGDGDATGAIVIEVISAPAHTDNWKSTQINVTLPAYPAINGLTRRTETIRWED